MTVKGVPPLPTTTLSVFTRGIPISSPASNTVVGSPFFPAERHTTGDVSQLLPLRRTATPPAWLFATGANAGLQPLPLRRTTAKRPRSCDENVTRVIAVPVSHLAAAERTVAMVTSPSLYYTKVPPFAHAAVGEPSTVEDPSRPGEVTSKGAPQNKKTSPTVHLTYRIVSAHAGESSSTALTAD